jgi:hypothetical protein
MRIIAPLIITLALSFWTTGSLAQGVAINTDNSPPDESAILDVSSTSGGVLIPRITEAQRDAISSPATGLMVFQTNNKSGFYYFNGSSWQLIGSGVFSIDDLSDGIFIGNSLYLGEDAGISDDESDNNNTGVGKQALRDNTSGQWNTGIGYQSLILNTDGERNTASGYQALFSNSTGTDNTAFGSRALFLNTTGIYNTVLGTASDYFNQEGSKNTMIGFQAGMGSIEHSKSGNVFIGFQAGFNDTTDNKLYIENSNSSTPLIYGEFDNELLRINGDLDITGDFIDFGIDELLDGRTLWSCVFLGTGAGDNDDGSNTFSAALGVDALNANISGKYNTAVGYQALSKHKTGDKNTAIGYKAMRNDTTGSSNTAIGSTALFSNTHGDGNTAIGNRSLYSNISGMSNTALGYQALMSNTEGNENTANGYMALYSNTNGMNNTASGYQALYSSDDGFDNTALGYQALFSITGEHANTAIGSQALYSIESGGCNTSVGYRSNYLTGSGSRNTMIGYEAGRGTVLHDKSDNVFIGYKAGYNDTTDNKLYIENSADTLPLIYGEFDNEIVAFNADVGIGDHTPTYKLDVAGKIGINDTQILYLPDQTEFTGSLFLGTGGNNLLHSFGSDGWYNTAFGLGALSGITQGNRNVATGNEALSNITTGYNNTALGCNAGFSNAEGHGNVYIGRDAGYNHLGSDRLYIANNSLAPLICGDFSDGSVMIGTSAKKGTLHVTDAFHDTTSIYIAPHSGAGHSMIHFGGSSYVDRGMYWIYDPSTDNLELWSQNLFGHDGPWISVLQLNGQITFDSQVDFDDRVFFHTGSEVSFEDDVSFEDPVSFTDDVSFAEDVSFAKNAFIADNVAIGGSYADGYKLSVDGKVICTEVRVEATASWPDYVFSKDYNLLSLQELEYNIRNNKHLPGIPSSDDIEKNGYELGNMQVKLLEKVEELTLYLIEQGKKIEDLEQKVTFLEDENYQLKK